MKFNAGCSKQRVVGLGIAMTLLSACATVNSERTVGACPPLAKYSQADQVRAADEVAALPEDSVLIDWLADYNVLRDQVRVCRA